MSSDSEDGGAGGRRSRKKAKADYSRPVGFVSSGIYAPQSQEPKQEKPSAKRSQTPESPKSSQPGLGSAGAGLGFGGGGGGGLGFSSGGAGLGAKTMQPPEEDEEADEEADEEEKMVLPTAFGRR